MQWDAADFRAAVATTLEGFVAEQTVLLGPLGPDATTLLEAARRAVSGGKRLRAGFCAWGYQAVTGPVGDEAEWTALLRAGGGLELLHASALVHDDVMDDSDTRRGQPASHKAFEELHRASGWTGPPRQYAAAAAILLGDLLLVWAEELLRGCGLPRERVAEAMRWFDVTRTEVIAGQFLDVSVQARGVADEEQAMRVLRYKSAKYSVERPLHVGASLAGAGPEVLAALSGYGLPIGEAFQLRDDMLGVYGDPEATGKPAGDDLTEGKRTVLVALALAGSDAGDGRLLEEGLGRRLDEHELERVRAVITASGAADRVEQRIRSLSEQALVALERAPISEVARRALRELAEAATQRAT